MSLHDGDQDQRHDSDGIHAKMTLLRSGEGAGRSRFVHFHAGRRHVRRRFASTGDGAHPDDSKSCWNVLQQVHGVGFQPYRRTTNTEACRGRPATTASVNAA